MWRVYGGSHVKARDRQAQHHCTKGFCGAGNEAISKSSRSTSIDIDSIPTDISPTTTVLTAGDAALPDDAFPYRMNKFQCTECIGDERLSYEERSFRFTRTSSRNNHFDSQHLPHLTKLLAHGLLACSHPKCTKMVRKFRTMEEYRSHQLRVHHIELRPAGGRAARSRKSSPTAGGSKSFEPGELVWRVESESPATPVEPCSGEGTFQVQDGVAETAPAVQMLNVAPPAWEMMECVEEVTTWQQFQPLPQMPMATWPA